MHLTPNDEIKSPPDPEGISIVVCCYNSEAIISKTIEHLCLQVVPDGINWEILLVDNNCTDRTVDTASAVVARYDSLSRFRVVKEKTPGLSFARIAGVKESQFDLVAFIDDDNRCSKDWVATAIESARNIPNTGAFGGRVVGDFSGDEASWVSGSPGMLACEQRPPASLGYEAREFLPGAGMVLRKRAFWSAFSNPKKPDFILSDRSGNAVVGGGDVELCLRLRTVGWDLGFVGALLIEHHIPAERMTDDYLLKLVRGNQKSQILVYWMRRNVSGEVKSGCFSLLVQLCCRQIGIATQFFQRFVVNSSARRVNWYGFTESLVRLFVIPYQFGSLRRDFKRIDNEFSQLRMNPVTSRN